MTRVLVWIISALRCCRGSPASTHTEIFHIPNSIPLADMVGKFSTKLTDIPCSWAGNMLSYPHFLPSRFTALWCSAVTSHTHSKLSYCPIKQDPCPCLCQILPRASSQGSDEPKGFRMDGLKRVQKGVSQGIKETNKQTVVYLTVLKLQWL